MIDPPWYPKINHAGVTNMKGSFRASLVAMATGALMMMATGAYAQAPGGGAGGPPRGGMGMGMGMGQLDRAGTLQRFALDDPALKLSDAQKAEINKAADAYVAQMNTVNEKYPFTPGSPPSQEGMAARQKVRDDFVAAVNKVLNDEQRKTWETAQSSRRGGMGMGPGGGMGGPGGRGGPGGPGGGPRPGGPGQ